MFLWATVGVLKETAKRATPMAFLIFLFFALIVASFLIGLAMRRAKEILKNQMTHWYASGSANPPILAVIFAVVLSYLTLTIFNLVVPTLSDPVFEVTNSARLDQREASIQLELRCKKIEGPLGVVRSVCLNVPTTVVRKIGIELEFPANVPVNEDFAVSAKATSNRSFPDGVYQAELFKPTTIEARTSDSCGDKQAADAVVSKACREAISSNVLDFRWALTPRQTGRAEIAIKTNTLDLSGTTESNPRGVVKLTYAGKSAAISANEPTLVLGDLELDGTRGEVRFPVQVLTTVGVDQTTYDWLKIVGAVISALAALFGAGFVLKLTGSRSED